MARALQTLCSLVSRSSRRCSRASRSTSAATRRRTTPCSPRSGEGAWNPEHDARPWLRFCLTAHYRQARTHLRRVQEVEELWVACVGLAERSRLPERAAAGLMDAAYGLRVRNARYRASIDFSVAEEIAELTASRDLKAMVDAGLLTRSVNVAGATTSRTTLSRDARAHPCRAPGQGPRGPVRAGVRAAFARVLTSRRNQARAVRSAWSVSARGVGRSCRRPARITAPTSGSISSGRPFEAVVEHRGADVRRERAEEVHRALRVLVGELRALGAADGQRLLEHAQASSYASGTWKTSLRRCGDGRERVRRRGWLNSLRHAAVVKSGSSSV